MHRFESDRHLEQEVTRIKGNFFHLLMYYVYILRSLKDKKLYIGQTGNLERRIAEHNLGICKSTKSGIPFELEHFEIYDTRSEAMKREKELKSGKVRERINKFLNGSI
jgi:putative endonuclease